jgi:hypothetical protein
VIPILVGIASHPTYAMIVSGADHEQVTRIRGLVAERKVPVPEGEMTVERGRERMGAVEVSPATLELLSPTPNDAERERIRVALTPYVIAPLGEAVLRALPAALLVPFWDEEGFRLFSVALICSALFLAFWMNTARPLEITGPHPPRELKLTVS